ncbi:hypothetical protein BT96DRAFT_960843 [Gymnopus androsaceus JB14]|uniref:Uncharacterized protein n=1 Tax=Gymnopus androsaceus JB14 TaxID=1447944 RepID=A0A6A4GHJ3_9AGAR|nr:hypothetical protein BT96DRAFT_960843 [Gymnopus androsaceus JB14]
MPCGYSFGGGQQEPMNFAMSKHNAAILDKVLGDPYMQRFARFMDRGLQVFFPQIHRLLSNLHHHLSTNNPALKTIFPGVGFAACHLNLGRARTKLHNDLKNIFFAVCGVGAFGPFNHKTGAHLIMWELGIVVEFPSGCGFLFPSATVSHANVPIGPDESRHSAAFFTSSGNLRYFHNGFMTDKEFRARASTGQLEAWNAYRKGLWQTGTDMLKAQPLH